MLGPEIEPKAETEDQGDLLYQQEVERVNSEYKKEKERMSEIPGQRELYPGSTAIENTKISILGWIRMRRDEYGEEWSFEDAAREFVKNAAEDGRHDQCIKALENTTLPISQKRTILAETYERDAERHEGVAQSSEEIRTAYPDLYPAESTTDVVRDEKWERDEAQAHREKVKILRGGKI
jgi:hypothetical protein